MENEKIVVELAKICSELNSISPQVTIELKIDKYKFENFSEYLGVKTDKKISLKFENNTVLIFCDN